MPAIAVEIRTIGDNKKFKATPRAVVAAVNTPVATVPAVFAAVSTVSDVAVCPVKIRRAFCNLL